MTQHRGSAHRDPAAHTLERRALLRGIAATAGALSLAGTVRAKDVAQEAVPPVLDGSNATLALARALTRTSYGDLPPQAVEHAKMILASTFASAAVGSGIESARILRDLAKEQGGRAECQVWFDDTRLPVALAARVNAGLSDAAASDDSDIRNTAHYGTTLAAAGLALGERAGVSGQDLLVAMAVGYEAGGRIGAARIGGPAGLHASQVVAFASAAASARLLRLSAAQVAHALGIVATTIGGIATGTNSWAREYMGANAAFVGVEAARAAGRGYTVNDDMLAARGGFVEVFGGGASAAARLTAGLGRSWDIVEYLAIKLWPGAHPFSGTLEAAVTAARQADVPAAAVAKILVSGQGRAALGGSRRPKDLVEAIHSLPYFVASAVADKDFTWVHATDAKIADPVVQRLMDLVEVDPAPPPVTYRWSWGGTVTIVTTAGARFTSTVDAPRGSAPRVIAWSDVEAKYRTLMPQSGLSSRRLDEILTTIHGLDREPNVARFARLLARRV